jgi:hypothetical protein
MRNYPTTGRTSQDNLEWSDEAQGRTVDLGTHFGGA